jgi:hypothetical protein
VRAAVARAEWAPVQTSALLRYRATRGEIDSWAPDRPHRRAAPGGKTAEHTGGGSAKSFCCRLCLAACAWAKPRVERPAAAVAGQAVFDSEVFLAQAMATRTQHDHACWLHGAVQARGAPIIIHQPPLNVRGEARTFGATCSSAIEPMGTSAAHMPKHSIALPAPLEE